MLFTAKEETVSELRYIQQESEPLSTSKSSRRLGKERGVKLLITRSP